MLSTLLENFSAVHIESWHEQDFNLWLLHFVQTLWPSELSDREFNYHQLPILYRYSKFIFCSAFRFQLSFPVVAFITLKKYRKGNHSSSAEWTHKYGFRQWCLFLELAIESWLEWDLKSREHWVPFGRYNWLRHQAMVSMSSQIQFCTTTSILYFVHFSDSAAAIPQVLNEPLFLEEDMKNDLNKLKENDLVMNNFGQTPCCNGWWKIPKLIMLRLNLLLHKKHYLDKKFFLIANMCFRKYLAI